MSFYVHASNIHTDESERFGPFPGSPGLTYEFVRVWANDDASAGSELDGAHVFRYAEERSGEEGFVHSDGGRVTFGWRRCYDQTDPVSRSGAFGVERGPYWTDMSFEWTDERNTIFSNELPIQAVLREPVPV